MRTASRPTLKMNKASVDSRITTFLHLPTDISQSNATLPHNVMLSRVRRRPSKRIPAARRNRMIIMTDVELKRFGGSDEILLLS
jgi:hypothetical protein